MEDNVAPPIAVASSSDVATNQNGDQHQGAMAHEVGARQCVKSCGVAFSRAWGFVDHGHIL
jgi:hypothetical protein